ncbi:MAG: serine/threonine protein kinase [Actinobacteria bacterium]|nr:MAG: serine/threonine protein kinase [Actinomycetota bacterium]
MGTAHPDSEPKIGDTFGPFRLEGLLGEGGMARVYRARREVDGETVALKLMKPELIGDDIFAKRFVHEARSAAEVRHANLVPIFDAGEVDGRYYLAVGYVNGRTVDDRIRAEGPLPLGDVVRFASDVASALDALHAAGIVHRDIKASNLLLDETGRTLLSDFGLAKGRAYTVLTRPGQVVGTLDYLAPELIRGEPATAASDIYAFGCTVYECVTGKTPFGDRPLLQVGLAHLDEVPADPATARSDCSGALSSAIVQALEKEPSRRPATATAYATLIQVAVEARP